MNSSKKNVEDLEQAQIKHWLNHLSVPSAQYKEPTFDGPTVEVVRLVCDVLHQEDDVFIASVDILEEYVHVKTDQNVEVANSVLSILCAILISSKLNGSHPDIKVATLQAVMKKLTKEDIDREAVKNAELDIFFTLGKLPLTTVANDLSMLLEYYVKTLKLRVNIEPLCFEILNVFYIYKRKIFFQVKSVYAESEDALQVFIHLVCNKLYFPGGIILCSLRITKFRNFFNLNRIAEDIGSIASIHHDHLQVLAGSIFENINVQ